MSYSGDVVADAVRGYWKTCYPRTVIAFFYQKYEYDTEWEWCEELVECNASNDFETVIFRNDFCEGQTCVKDISIVSLDDIVECYTKNHISNHISSMSDLISRQDVIELVKNSYYNLAESLEDTWAMVADVERLSSVQPETAKRIVGKSRDGMTFWYQCDMCNEPVDAQDNFCRGCGRRLIDE